MGSSPIYAQDSASKSPSLNGHWVSSEYNFESGKPEDRGAATVAMVWSDKNAAVSVAIYATPDIPKEKVIKYGEGMMRIFAKKEIPANFYAQHLDSGKKEGLSFGFFVHGYPFGTYGGAETVAGIQLAIDGFNGEDYINEMLADGRL